MKKEKKRFKVDGQFVMAYSEAWGKEKIVGYLKKGMTLRQWIKNKALYDANKEEREKLISQLVNCQKQVSRIMETSGDPTHYLYQRIILEMELDRLMAAK